MSKVYNQTLLDEMIRRQSLPVSQVKQAAHEILAIIREGLIRDGVVNVSNFGTFRLKDVAERKGINPQTRETIIIRAHQRVFFSPCKALREMIQPLHQPPEPLEDEDSSIQTLKPGSVAVYAAQLEEKQTAPETSIEKEHVETPSLSSLESKITPHAPPEKEAVQEASASAHMRTEKVTAQEAEEIQKNIPTTGIATSVEDNSHPSESSTFPIEEDHPKQTKDPALKGKYYQTSAAILLIALVCTGLYYEFGIMHEVPSTTNKNSTLTASSEQGTADPVASYKTHISANKTPQANNGETIPSEVLASSTTADESLKPISDITLAPSNNDKRTGQSPSSTTVSTAASIPDTSGRIFFSEKEHQLVHGENLWKLAERYYQHPLLWPHIYQANADNIANPDHLSEGGTIVIPTLQGTPEKLSKQDRHNLAEGYYLAYLYYKKRGNKEAFFALLEAKRYDSSVVEKYRHQLQLSLAEQVMLRQQQAMPF